MERGPTEVSMTCVKAKGTGEMGKHVASATRDTEELSSQVTTEPIALAQGQDPHCLGAFLSEPELQRPTSAPVEENVPLGLCFTLGHRPSRQSSKRLERYGAGRVGRPVGRKLRQGSLLIAVLGPLKRGRDDGRGWDMGAG